MSIRDEVQDLKEDMGVIRKHLESEEVKRVKKKEFKLPFGIKMNAKKAIKRGKVLCVLLRSNKSLEFRIVPIFGGLVQIDNYSYNAYESDAVYVYKRLPVIVAFEWRMLNVGGIAEKDYCVVGGSNTEEHAKKNSLINHAQQAIIRSFEEAKTGDGKKKKKGMNPLFLIIGVVVAIAVLGGVMGWF